MASVAVLVPVAVGVKPTVIVQLAPAATEPPQLFVWLKSPLLVPLIAKLVIVRRAVPVFVSVTFIGVSAVPTRILPNDKLVFDRLTTGPTPVPVRLAVCGLFVALSVTLSVAVRVPAAVGLKVTLIVQFAPAATLAPQLFVCA